MTNRKALDFYRSKIGENTKQGDEKLLSQNNNTDLDAKFINNYCNETTRLLDLGSGSGLILDKISKNIKNITAVEFLPELASLIKSRTNLRVVTADLLNYTPDQEYDLITFFGTAHHFTTEEVLVIYKYVYNYLAKGGILIVKNQFGINEDVIVDGYSEEIEENYYACYRHLPEEQERLRRVGFNKVSSHDIYPPEKNKWSNTHYYALVCHKP